MLCLAFGFPTIKNLELERDSRSCTQVTAMAEKKLSLPARKNLRDNEEKKKENLTRIEGITGKSSVEFALKDEVKVAEALAKNGYTDRLGEIFYSSYLEQLAECLEKLCDNPHTKSALNQKWVSNKIYFEIDEKAPSYQNVDFPKGDLRIFCTSDRVWSNLGELGAEIPLLLTSEVFGASLSLKSSQNIRKYEEEGKAQLAAIGAAIGRGGPVNFVVEDIKAVDAAINKAGGYDNKIGEIIWGSYLTSLAEKLTSLCADDMVKEAIGDAFKGNLIFKLDPKAEGYQHCKFVGGNLEMSCNPAKIWVNMGELGNDIEGQL